MGKDHHAAHRARVAARQERFEAIKKQCEAELERERNLRAALAKPTSTAAARIHRFIEVAGALSSKQTLSELLNHILDVAPKLVDDSSYLVRLKHVCDASWIRPLNDWVPRGKGRETLFVSLVEHLFAKYRMPTFLWSAFSSALNDDTFICFAADVARGGSPYKTVQEGLIPMPLTRAMCHDLMSTTGDMNILHAIRRVQVRAAGGDANFFRTWMATSMARTAHSKSDEAFYATALQWFCANPMLPAASVSPMVDYILHRRREDPAFSLKGRSMLAMQRGQREWHGDLAKARGGKTVFKPSGFEPMDIDCSYTQSTGEPHIEVWHFREILTGKELADEGRVMKHCVWSYSGLIERGACSIWTLTLEDATGHWRRLTIEVRNSTKTIVQARGQLNKLPQAQDLIQLRTWAAKNNLTITTGRW